MVKKQIEHIEKKEWGKRGIPKENISTEPAYYILEKIDELIKRFEGIEGFPRWVIEAKTSNSFEDPLFELMVLDNLLSKSDSLILKFTNPISNNVPEALMKRGDDTFYVEMKKLRDLPGSIQNKVNSLFKKS